MKKSISILLGICVLWVMTFQTSCIGSFKLTKSYWDWNSGLSKWPGAVFFFFLGGLITGVTLLVDVVILNLIEFWSGSNPMSMQEGEMERQLIVGTDGNSYEVTATKNRFDIVQMSGSKKGEIQSLVFDPQAKSWSHEKACETNKIIQYSADGALVSLYTADGRTATLPTSISDRNLAGKMISDQLKSQVCVN